jgi:predicted component of type VI protein secretion system
MATSNLDCLKKQTDPQAQAYVHIVSIYLNPGYFSVVFYLFSDWKHSSIDVVLFVLCSCSDPVSCDI